MLRYHLALKIPEPREACRLRVGGEYANWDEGKSLLFDDSYEHEAWNDTDGERVVLFMDVVRPLKSPVRQVNDLHHQGHLQVAFYVGDAKRRHLDWEKKFEELRRAESARDSCHLPTGR